MTMPSIPLTKSKGLRALLRELSDDEEDVAADTMDIHTNPQWPWLCDIWMFVSKCQKAGWQSSNGV